MVPEHALPTRCVQWNDVIAYFDIVHPLSYALDDTSSLVAQNDRESAFGIFSREGIGVSQTSDDNSTDGCPDTHVWQIPVLSVSCASTA